MMKDTYCCTYACVDLASFYQPTLMQQLHLSFILPDLHPLLLSSPLNCKSSTQKDHLVSCMAPYGDATSKSDLPFVLQSCRADGKLGMLVKLTSISDNLNLKQCKHVQRSSLYSVLQLEPIDVNLKPLNFPFSLHQGHISSANRNAKYELQQSKIYLRA